MRHQLSIALIVATVGVIVWVLPSQAHLTCRKCDAHSYCAYGYVNPKPLSTDKPVDPEVCNSILGQKMRKNMPQKAGRCARHRHDPEDANRAIEDCPKHPITKPKPLSKEDLVNPQLQEKDKNLIRSRPLNKKVK